MRRTNVLPVWTGLLFLCIAGACSQGPSPKTGTADEANDPVRKKDCAALREGVESKGAPKAAVNDLEHRAERLAALRLDTPELTQLASDLGTNLRELSKAMNAIDAVSARQVSESAVRSAAVERFECKKEPEACKAFLGPMTALSMQSPNGIEKMIAQMEKVQFNEPAMASGAKEVLLSLQSLRAAEVDLATANDGVVRASSKLDALSQTFDRLCP